MTGPDQQWARSTMGPIDTGPERHWARKTLGPKDTGPERHWARKTPGPFDTGPTGIHPCIIECYQCGCSRSQSKLTVVPTAHEIGIIRTAA